MVLSKKLVIVCATLCLAASASVSLAQQNAPNATSQRSSGNQQLDANMASCLILGNQNEIAAAKLAEKNAKSDKVKSFAQMMVKDHGQFIDELSKFTTQTYRDRDTSTSATSAKSNTQANTDNNNPWAIQAQISHEMANECLASIHKELDKKEGADFDECYIGMQIGAHMKMIDELKVLERHALPQFQSVLKEGRQTAEKHLERAKDIKKSLASDSKK